MKATLLNGCIENDAFGASLVEQVNNELKATGSTADMYVLRELEITSCTGCFGCWVKTPGNNS